MSLPVAFRRAAQAEYDDAGDWYEARRAGLGRAFTSAVQGVFDQYVRGVKTWRRLESVPVALLSRRKSRTRRPRPRG